MSPGDVPGPHRSVPQNEQQRVALQGRLLTGGKASLVVIRDPDNGDFVVYFQLDPERAISIPAAEIELAAAKWHVWKAEGKT